MSRELEKALETWANSKKEGHEQFIQLFEQWGINFDKKIQEILDYMNKWFSKKENQFSKLFRIFGE